jgi:hypothetical protein
MKRIILFLIALSSVFLANAQAPPKIPQALGAKGFETIARDQLTIDSALKLPKDTIKLLLKDTGAIAFKNGIVYVWKGNPAKWFVNTGQVYLGGSGISLQGNTFNLGSVPITQSVDWGGNNSLYWKMLNFNYIDFANGDNFGIHLGLLPQSTSYFGENFVDKGYIVQSSSGSPAAGMLEMRHGSNNTVHVDISKGINLQAQYRVGIGDSTNSGVFANNPNLYLYQYKNNIAEDFVLSTDVNGKVKLRSLVGIGQNFANTDLAFTGNRVHALGANTLQLNANNGLGSVAVINQSSTSLQLNSVSTSQKSNKLLSLPNNALPITISNNGAINFSSISLDTIRVTVNKLQVNGNEGVATGLWGRDGSGFFSNITLGGNMTLVGNVLNSTGGSGVTDGDKGDLTVSSSGTVWTIDNLAITNAKINDVAWSKVTGTPTTYGGYGLTPPVSSVNSGNLSPLFTTVVTNSTTTPAISYSLTNALDSTVFGNPNATTGAPSYMTMAQLAAMLPPKDLYLDLSLKKVNDSTIGAKYDSAMWNANKLLGLVLDFTVAPGDGQALVWDNANSIVKWATVSGGGGISDGDKGDLTVSASGTTWTIDNLAVTNAKINDVAWTKITSRPTTVAASDLTDAVSLGGTQTLTNKTFTTPTISSTGFTNAQHGHLGATSGGLLSEAALSFSDVTTGNASTGAHGYLKKLNNDATYYMDGTGNWSQPAGGGGGGVNTMAAIGSSPNANGASISSTTLTLQPASASFGGVMTTGTQTIVGNKTWGGTQFLNALSAQVTGLVFLGTGGEVKSNSGFFNVDETNGYLGIGIGGTPPLPLSVATNLSNYNPVAVFSHTKSDGYVQVKLDGTGNDWGILVGNAGETSFNLANDFALWNATSNTAAFVMDQNNRMGINVANPTNRLELAETATALTTANLYTVRATNSGTYNATAAVRASAAGYFTNTATRSAGSNNLTNYGIWAEASGGQVNVAGRFDGDMIFNFGSDATGDIVYRASDGTYNRLGIGTSSQVLIGGTTPTYSSVSLTSMVSNVLPIANGGTNLSTYTTGDLPYASATNTLSKLAIGSTGNVLGISGGVPAWVSNGVTSVGLSMPSGFSVGSSPVTSTGTLAVTTTLNGVILGNGSGFSAVSYSTLLASLGIESGIYTPTATSIFNASSITVAGFKYIKSGLIVHVSGRVNYTSGAATTATVIKITLPISTNLQNDDEVTGVVSTVRTGTASNTAGRVSGGSFNGNTTDAYLYFTSVSNDTESVWVEFDIYLNPE